MDVKQRGRGRPTSRSRGSDRAPSGSRVQPRRRGRHQGSTLPSALGPRLSLMRRAGPRRGSGRRAPTRMAVWPDHCDPRSRFAPIAAAIGSLARHFGRGRGMRPPLPSPLLLPPRSGARRSPALGATRPRPARQSRPGSGSGHLVYAEGRPPARTTVRPPSRPPSWVCPPPGPGAAPCRGHVVGPCPPAPSPLRSGISAWYFGPLTTARGPAPSHAVGVGSRVQPRRRGAATGGSGIRPSDEARARALLPSSRRTSFLAGVARLAADRPWSVLYCLFGVN